MAIAETPRQLNKYINLRADLRDLRASPEVTTVILPRHRLSLAVGIKNAFNAVAETKPKSTDSVSNNSRVPTSNSEQGSGTSNQFFTDLDSVKPLSAKEQTELAWKVYNGRAAARELVSNHELAEKEKAPLQEKEKIGKEARTQVVEANLRLIISIAKRYADRGVPLLDLINEGVIGAIHAMDNFDPEKGYRVTTYMHWVTQTHIRNAAMEKSRVIKVTRASQERRTTLMRQHDLMVQELGRLPSDQEAANRLGIKSGEMATLKTMMQDASISIYATEDDGIAIVDTLISPDPESNPQQMTERLEVFSKVEEAMGDINDPKVALALRLRLGLDNEGIPLEYSEIAKTVGQSKQRNKQRFDQGMEILKQNQGLAKIKDYN